MSLHVVEEEERQGCSCWGLFVVLGFVLPHFVYLFCFAFFSFFGGRWVFGFVVLLGIRGFSVIYLVSRLRFLV